MRARSRVLQELRELRAQVAGICERLDRMEISVERLVVQARLSQCLRILWPWLGKCWLQKPARVEPASSVNIETCRDLDRERAAQTTGKFFNRCLQGRPRGDPGRPSVRLRNHYYVVCRDDQGRRYTDPVKVFSRFSSVRLLVSRGGHSSDFGDSAFAGFHSIWEAKVAVETADLAWPSKIDC